MFERGATWWEHRTFADPPIEVPQWAVWRRDEASAAVHQFVATCTSIEHELAEV